ncbi:Zinc dependent phospholipase C [Thalassobacillus cyri]|uniref:Zinc dependent phospholipase C n=1 Tax=Thalassobacillus cyri TaxID=571932 RepID=A0A1H4GHG7_9BACI|nr:zinc dependent phospholipase C family protein [Thalassobacillus cyri]SEB09049.1 Zinc dependent phospholipase C [Thalassobacillus cyri]
MPNIWTHIHFSQSLLDTLEHTERFKILSAYVKLGAQGPDPFFYHRFWPFLESKGVEEVGMRLHTEYCGDFLLDLIKQGKEAPASSQAYIFGFLTHHILDRNTHPYIHYRAGYEGNKHQELEVIIDTLLLEREKNMKTWRNPVHKQIDVGKRLDKWLIRLLDTTIKKYFADVSTDLPGDYIQESYYDMKTAMRVLYDPTGWKNKLLGSLVSSFSHRPVEETKDYLNINENEWRHPATGETKQESFDELYEKAFDEGKEILTLLLHYWQNGSKNALEELKDKLANISYDTGEPLHKNLINQFSAPIV